MHVRTDGSTFLQSELRIYQTPSDVTKAGDSESHNNMPPYYALCAIQKIGPDETDQINERIAVLEGTMSQLTAMLASYETI